MTKQELENCIDQYGRDIYSFCRQLTRNQTEAEDLYQDTFLAAVERSEKIDFQNNPKSYLLSIVLGIWRNRKRKYAWRKRIAGMKSLVDEQEVESGEATEPSVEEQIVSREEKAAVWRAVNKLPERLRMVILLYYMEEQSTMEIAALLKIPKGTVLSRLYQARKKLEKELEDVLDAKRTE